MWALMVHPRSTINFYRFFHGFSRNFGQFWAIFTRMQVKKSISTIFDQSISLVPIWQSIIIRKAQTEVGWNTAIATWKRHSEHVLKQQAYILFYVANHRKDLHHYDILRAVHCKELDLTTCIDCRWRDPDRLAACVQCERQLCDVCRRKNHVCGVCRKYFNKVLTDWWL